MTKQDENKTRVEAFLKEYKELVEKHEIDFANYPVLVPAEDHSFKLVMQSTPVDLRLQKLNKSFIKNA